LQDSLDYIVAKQTLCNVICCLTEERRENFPEYDLFQKVVTLVNQGTALRVKPTA